MNVCGGGSGPSAFFGEGESAPLLSPFRCDRGGDARELTSDLTLPGIFVLVVFLWCCDGVACSRFLAALLRVASPKALQLTAALEALKLSFAAFFEANYYEDQFRQSLSHALAAHWS
jgi:hypothetical protein